MNEIDTVETHLHTYSVYVHVQHLSKLNSIILETQALTKFNKFREYVYKGSYALQVCRFFQCSALFWNLNIM